MSAFAASDITMWVSKDQSEWIEVADFYQDHTIDFDQQYSYEVNKYNNTIPPVNNIEELEARDDIFLELTVPMNNEKYQYIKIVVDNVYYGTGKLGGNRDQRWSASELEVYVDSKEK